MNNDDITVSVRGLAENARNYATEKEMIGAYSVVGVAGGRLRELVTCRLWMGRSRSALTVYASVWVHGPGLYASGKGSAGGGGYHKASAAIDAAIRSAGFDVSREVTGDGLVIEALEALARLAGGEGELMTVRH